MSWLFRRKKKQETVTYCAAVVPAAGSSSRMGGEDKILLPLRGVPVIVHTLQVLENSPRIHEIIVVTREDLIVPIAQLCKDFSLQKVTKIIVGGETRLHSVRQGLIEVSENAQLVAIHDGARPLLSQSVLDQVIDLAVKTGAAAPAVPVKDTIKKALSGVVQETPDRSELFAVQTPQVFSADLIKAATYKAVEENSTVTDDCSVVEALGMKVTLSAGSDENIKITTPVDMIMAEAILEARFRQ